MATLLLLLLLLSSIAAACGSNPPPNGMQRLCPEKQTLGAGGRYSSRCSAADSVGDEMSVRGACKQLIAAIVGRRVQRDIHIPRLAYSLSKEKPPSSSRAASIAAAVLVSASAPDSEAAASAIAVAASF